MNLSTLPQRWGFNIAQRTMNRRTSTDRAICIEWKETGVVVCEFKTTPTGWEIVQEFEVRWGADVPQDAELRGRQLRDALAAHHVKASATYIAFPRNRVIFKLLSIPSISEHQLPDAVLLQCEARHLSPNDFAIDFVTLPLQTNSAEQPAVHKITVAAVRIDILDDLRTTIAQCHQLEIQSIGIGEFGIAGSLSRHSCTAQLLLFAEPSELHFLVTFMGVPITAVGLPTADESDEVIRAIKSTVARIENSLVEQGIDSQFESFCITGPESDRLFSAFRSSDLPIPERFASPSQFSARCWGMLQTQEHVDGFNFQKPRALPQSSVKSRKHWKGIAVRVALAGLLLMILRQWYVDRLDRQTDALRQQLGELSQNSHESQAAIDRANELATWSDSEIKWSSQLVSVLEQFPANDRVFLNQIRLEKTDGQPSMVRLEGLGRELDDVISLNQRLMQDASKFQLRPEQINRSESDPHYQVNFAINAEIETRGNE